MRVVRKVVYWAEQMAAWKAYHLAESTAAVTVVKRAAKRAETMAARMAVPTVGAKAAWSADSTAGWLVA